jgi:hypothetical protein
MTNPAERKLRQALTRRACLRWLALAGAGTAAAACGAGPSSNEQQPAVDQEAPASQPAAAQKTPTSQAKGSQETPSSDVTAPQPAPSSQPINPPSSEQPYLVVSRGDDPAAITERALAALGGMERFVKQG